MKAIAGAIFVLAAAILFGAEVIADAVAQGPGRPSSYGCAVTIVGVALTMIGLGFIAAEVADQWGRPDDPLLRTAMRRALKAKTTTENEPPQGGPDSV